ncbi:MAG: hypothetical protein ACKPKO_19565, partial [Candidatus Fonsibacter sp.]
RSALCGRHPRANQQIANVLNRIRSNQSMTSSNATFAKHATLSWCLYKAHRDTERQLLSRAVCMNII